MRVPGQFNPPALPHNVPGQPEWFRSFLRGQALLFQQLAQALTGPTRVARGEVPATVTVKPYAADLTTLTLTQGVAVTLDVGTRPGAEGLIEVTQDAVGGWAITWTNALTSPAIDATANKRTLLAATYTGNGWVLRVAASGY